MYKVIVGNRTFNTFDKKEKAIDCANNCLDLGYNNVCVTYGNGKIVPKTPVYKKMEERKFNPCKVYIYAMHPWVEVSQIKADTIHVIGDYNKFYREFYYKEELMGRYDARTFTFDFGEEIERG